MTQYKLTLVVSPEIDGTDTKKMTDLVKKFVGAVATVTGVTLQGKKVLAYPIQKKSEGFFLEALVESDRLHVADLQKQVEPGTDIMRFLLTTI
jgi:small subunit ribosomal protein S6